jgi:hypothetical protein
MGNIAVLSSDDKLNNKILELCAEFKQEFTPVYLRDKTRILQYLSYELPELNIFNLSDRYVKTRDILEEIKKEPWLHYGSIIVIHDQDSDKEVAKTFRDVNILSLIRRQELDFYFTRLLRILSRNRSILFQRDIHSILKSNLSGSFVMDNDPFDMTTYANLLSNFLYNANLINHDQKERFHVAMMELLINAIEHGNCQISYEEKSAWQEQDKDILDLIREKNKNAKIAKKKVYLSYKISPVTSAFTIRDEGPGFDWEAYQTPTGKEGLKESHGRGISMARLYIDKLTYNGTGNEVCFEIAHLKNESNVVPQAFTDMEEIVIKDKQEVFTRGEQSSHLYYIVSGTYDVYLGKKKVSTLTPDDIFMGEMSFLLNNKRSATVRAVGKGALIRISKEAFISSIKNNPHYGIFLARLLAQRLQRLNERFFQT